MATNRPDTLDPALVRPGRLDRKIEFALPELEVYILLITISCTSVNPLFAGSCAHFQNSCKADERRTQHSLRPPRSIVSQQHRYASLLFLSFLHNHSLISGAEIRSVCTEAGMFAIRARRKVATEKDFLEAINKVIKGYAKFSATPRYLTHN